jgi:hypothetical protein
MASLTQSLEAQITDALVMFQGSGGKDAVKDALIGLVNPDEPPYVTMNQALARMAAAHTLIQTARDAGDTFAWVSPRFAAAAFEGIFESCVGVWLAAGDPPTPTQLRPSVESFVKSQVRMFGALIGAN